MVEILISKSFKIIILTQVRMLTIHTGHIISLAKMEDTVEGPIHGFTIQPQA